MNTEEIIDAIKAQHRRRCFGMEARKRAHLTLCAFLRTQLGWSRDLPTAERGKIAAAAKAIASMKEPAGELQSLVEASHFSSAPFERVEEDATKRMTQLAKQLPVWLAFADGVKGFGALGLAIIVAEAGDLSNYPDKSKLWKRLGLGLVGDIRQGGLPRGASAEDWIEHAYNRQRRSRIWTLGDAMKKRGDVYREIYLQRKGYERAKAEAAGLIVAPSAEIPEKRAAEFMSLGHIDRRAQRYMEKRLVRDLWQAWNRANEDVPNRPGFRCPEARLAA